MVRAKSIRLENDARRRRAGVSSRNWAAGPPHPRGGGSHALRDIGFMMTDRKDVDVVSGYGALKEHREVRDCNHDSTG